MDIKRVTIGTAVLFVLWSAMDMVIHGVMLGDIYASAPGVFRDMAEMHMGLLYGTVAVGALGYALLYGLNAPRARWADSLVFGALFGLATGFGMGFGTYSVMPIPLAMAWGWFAGSIAESLAAAAALHLVFRPRRA